MKWIVFFLPVFSLFLFAQPATTFGSVSLAIDGKTSQDFVVANAYLFSDVEIGYDTTSQSQIGDETTFFYYPQLRQGENRILHLILSPDSLLPAENGEGSFYDFYLRVGADFEETVSFANADSNIFLAQNGRFSSVRRFSSVENGTVNLKSVGVDNRTEGDLDLRFQLPVDGGDTFEAVHLTGTLTFSEDNFRRGEATSLASVKPPNNHRRNLVVALLTAGLVILGTSL